MKPKNSKRIIRSTLVSRDHNEANVKNGGDEIVFNKPLQIYLSYFLSVFGLKEFLSE